MQYGTITYLSGAGANQIVTTKKAILHRILVGKDVASAVIECSDSASDGNGNVQVYAAGSTLMTATGGVIEVNAHFHQGIALDLTNQTNVAVVWSPVA